MPLFRYLLGFALLAFTLLSAEPAFPELTSRVVDEASLFSAAQKAELDRRLASCDASPNEGKSWEEIKRRLETAK